jgi:hypothetical protein
MGIIPNFLGPWKSVEASVMQSQSGRKRPLILQDETNSIAVICPALDDNFGEQFQRPEKSMRTDRLDVNYLRF